MSAKKILVTGDVLGNFSKFFKRLKNLNETKGPFDFVLCAGSFFSYDDENSEDPNLVYIAKDFDINLQIYVLGPVIKSQKRYYKPLFTEDLRGPPLFENGFDLAVNVTYLGKKGVLTTIDGINIAYLSGVQSEQSTDCSYNIAEVDQLIDKAKVVGVIDILITRNYPLNVNQYSLGAKSKYLKELSEHGSLLVSKLAKFIMPRYHFSGASDTEYFEREPYRNHLIMQEQPKLVTRFISIAKVKEETKPKWLFAFGLTPAKLMSREELIKQPDDTTENPYLELDFNMNRIKREKGEKLDEPEQQNSSFFFGNLDQQRQNNNRNNNRNGRGQVNGGERSNNDFNDQNNRKRPNQNDDESEKRSRQNEGSCWFCLSSPQVEKHLIISVGDHSYLALAKGGLVTHHLLLLPIGHFRSIIEIESNQEHSDVVQEIGRFKNALIDYFMTKDQVPVFFERNWKSAHLQLQVIPVSKDKISDIKSVLFAECEQRNMIINEIHRGAKLFNYVNGDRVPYFYIEFRGERFLIRIKPSKGFPMQFGRELLAHPELLNCQNRIDWRNCELNAEDAKTLTKTIREEFKPHDFSTDL